MVSVHDAEEIKFFLDELEENLEYLDSAIMALEENPTDQENLDEIFRVAHTIKGSAGFLDLTNLVELGHAMENVFQKFQAGDVPITKEVIDTVLECKDRIGEIGRMLGRQEDTSTVDTTDLIQRVNSFLAGSAAPAAKTPAAKPEPDQESKTGAPAAPPAPEVAQEGVRIVQIVISPNELAPSIRAFLVGKNLEKLGEIVKQEPSEEVMDADDYEMPADRTVLFWLNTGATDEEIIEEANVDLIDQVNIVSDEKPQHASPLQPAADLAKGKKPGAKEDIETSDTVRMPVSRLDVMLNLVGELVIANSSFLQIQETLRSMGRMDHIYRDVRDRTKDLVRISSEIQDLVMKSRLVPISQVFNRFKRFVRDFSSKSKKKIRLEMLGENTEIDKKIIDEMIKPLTHLVRNSLDHGLESPEERTAAGKPDTGLLRLTASQEGNYIYVIIEDNGRGLNYARIVEKAVERGLIDHDEAQTLNDDEIKELIFHSGFSTKEEVDEMSGRGVGMDVVKRSVENLNGTIIIDSRQGAGTIITIKLPLTLAILNALIVRVGKDRFCIPMSSIVETQKVNAKNFLTVENNEMVRLRDSLIPVIKLDKIFPEATEEDGKNSDAKEETPVHETPEAFRPDERKKELVADEYPVIVVDFHDTNVAILVDQFLSRQEMVIKSLSEHYRSIEGISGASILGDGSIILIIDVHGVIQLYRQQRGIRIFQESSELPAQRLPRMKRPDEMEIPATVVPAARVPAPEVKPSAKAVETIAGVSSITPEQFEQLEDLEISTAMEDEEPPESPDQMSKSIDKPDELIGAHEFQDTPVTAIPAKDEPEEIVTIEEEKPPAISYDEDIEGVDIFDSPDEPQPESAVSEAADATDTLAGGLDLEEKRIEEETGQTLEVKDEREDSIIIDETDKPEKPVEIRETPDNVVEDVMPPATSSGAQESVYDINIDEIEQEMKAMDRKYNGEEEPSEPTAETPQPPTEPEPPEPSDIIDETPGEAPEPETVSDETEEPVAEESGDAEGESEFDKMRRMMETGEYVEDDQPLPIDSIALSHFNREEYNFDKLNNILNGTDAEALESWLREGTMSAIEGIKSLTGHDNIFPGKTVARKYSPEKILSHFQSMRENEPGFVALLLPIMPVDGMMYMLLTEKNARTMASMLYEAAEMDTPEVIDLDPLMEVTNILGSSYTNSLTQLADLPIEPGIPEIIETTDQVMESINRSIESIRHSILFIENQFLWQEKVVLAELFIMIPDLKH